VTRRFVDAPQGERCAYVIELKDGTLADCGRYRKAGDFCTQHARIERRNADSRTTKQQAAFDRWARRQA
jgi:hypothetical protein